MITVNLLAQRQVIHRSFDSGLWRQILFVVVVFLLVGSGCWEWDRLLEDHYQQLTKEKQRKEAMLVNLRTQGEQAEHLRNKQHDLLEAYQVLHVDSRKVFAPVQLLDEVSQSLESLKIWLLKLSMEGSHVDMEGEGLTNAEVVQFLDHLEKSSSFQFLTGIETTQQSYGGQTLRHFTIAFSLKE